VLEVWSIGDRGTVELTGDGTPSLRAADPSGRDSCGARGAVLPCDVPVVWYGATVAVRRGCRRGTCP
jgi:hypothetical protein